MANTLSKENELQRKAFELYYGLGDKRSLRAVAETIGRTERTVAGWSRAFNWVARVTQRNIENAQNSNEAKITAELTDVGLSTVSLSITLWLILVRILHRAR